MRGGQIVISPSTLYRKNNFRDLHSDGKLQKEQKNLHDWKIFRVCSSIWQQPRVSLKCIHLQPHVLLVIDPSRAGPRKMRPLVPHGQDRCEVRWMLQLLGATCPNPNPFTEHIITIINLHPKGKKKKKGRNQGAQTAWTEASEKTFLARQEPQAGDSRGRPMIGPPATGEWRWPVEERGFTLSSSYHTIPAWSYRNLLHIL